MQMHKLKSNYLLDVCVCMCVSVCGGGWQCVSLSDQCCQIISSYIEMDTDNHNEGPDLNASCERANSKILIWSIWKESSDWFLIILQNGVHEHTHLIHVYLVGVKLSIYHFVCVLRQHELFLPLRQLVILQQCWGSLCNKGIYYTLHIIPKNVNP